MFKSIALFSVLGLALVAGCARPAPAEGSLQLVLSAPCSTAEGAAELGVLAINGVDHPFRARVELSGAAGVETQPLRLPAGLYSVDVVASAPSERTWPELVSTTPHLVVVAAGHVSTLTLRAPDESEPTALAEAL